MSASDASLLPIWRIGMVMKRYSELMLATMFVMPTLICALLAFQAIAHTTASEAPSHFHIRQHADLQAVCGQLDADDAEANAMNDEANTWKRTVFVRYQPIGWRQPNPWTVQVLCAGPNGMVELTEAESAARAEVRILNGVESFVWYTRPQRSETIGLQGGLVEDACDGGSRTDETGEETGTPDTLIGWANPRLAYGANRFTVMDGSPLCLTADGILIQEDISYEWTDFHLANR